jgi:hypothetical protein
LEDEEEEEEENNTRFFVHNSVKCLNILAVFLKPPNKYAKRSVCGKEDAVSEIKLCFVTTHPVDCGEPTVAYFRTKHINIWWN